MRKFGKALSRRHDQTLREKVSQSRMMRLSERRSRKSDPLEWQPTVTHKVLRNRLQFVDEVGVNGKVAEAHMSRDVAEAQVFEELLKRFFWALAFE